MFEAISTYVLGWLSAALSHIDGLDVTRLYLGTLLLTLASCPVAVFGGAWSSAEALFNNRVHVNTEIHPLVSLDIAAWHLAVSLIFDHFPSTLAKNEFSSAVKLVSDLDF